jgi:hypothetical protein
VPGSDRDSPSATAVNGTAILVELVRSRLRRLPRSTVCAGLGAPDDRHRPARRGPACAGRPSRRLSPALTPGQRRRLDFIYGWIRQWIRSGPSELPSREADGLTDRSPTPHHIVVPACRSGGQGGVAAPRVHLPNSPRHHAGTSAAGRRSRTGRYECRHHSRPIVLAGVNIRRYVQIVSVQLDSPIIPFSSLYGGIRT